MNTKEYFYLSDEELMHLIDLSETDGLPPPAPKQLKSAILTAAARALPATDPGGKAKTVPGLLRPGGRGLRRLSGHVVHRPPRRAPASKDRRPGGAVRRKAQRLQRAGGRTRSGHQPSTLRLLL